MTLYSAMASVSFCCSRTYSPESSFSMSTSSGRAMWRIMTSRTRHSTSAYSGLRGLPPGPAAATSPDSGGMGMGEMVAGAAASSDDPPGPPDATTAASDGSAGLYIVSVSYSDAAQRSQNSTQILKISASPTSDACTR